MDLVQEQIILVLHAKFLLSTQYTEIYYVLILVVMDISLMNITINVLDVIMLAKLALDQVIINVMLARVGTICKMVNAYNSVPKTWIKVQL